jgi:hypothetical protein
MEGDRSMIGPGLERDMRNCRGVNERRLPYILRLRPARVSGCTCGSWRWLVVWVFCAREVRRPPARNRGMRQICYLEGHAYFALLVFVLCCFALLGLVLRTLLALL